MRTILLTFILASLLSSCYYDKFENHKPKQTCDTTTNVGYASKIKPIIDAQCNSCHAGVAPIGVLNLDTYASLKLAAQSGKLLSSIIWDGKASPMPKGSYDKIDECSINSIKNWINSNYLQ